MKKVHDSETPAHGQQKMGACAFIHDEFDGVIKVLLPRRADTKKFLPGLFEIPGGHIDYGEDLVEGLKREIIEELGVKISVGDPFSAFTYINEVKGSHTLQVTFFAKLIKPHDKIRLNPEDHSEYRWITEKELIANRNFIIPEGQVQFHHEEDPEYLTMLRGFQILNSKTIKFS